MENTECYRGWPSAKLFFDIDQLTKGDRFYLHILNEDLAYEVDQILPMIEKDDYDGEPESTPVESMVQAIQNYYMLYLLSGMALTVLVILIMYRMMRKKKNHKEEER